MRNARRFAILLATILVASSVAGAAQGEGGEPVRRALLIGVNDYLANDPSERQKRNRPNAPSGGDAWIPVDLRGAINDIEKMRGVLTSRYGFEENGIRVLADRDATRSAILEAMRTIVEVSQPGDLVYIHFSGHGSQARDRNKDETDDELDETILSYDARTTGIPDITDDEIGAILAGLKTRNALIVLDSCHSGTATRDISAIRTRMVAADPRTELYENNEVTTRSLGPTGREYVLMTGAASNQSALDGPIDGKSYGFFSYALGKALSNAPAQATTTDVHALVLKEFERLSSHFGLASMPDPQVEGPEALTGRPVLSVPDPVRLAWAEVRPTSRGKAILVRAVPLGAQVGAMWAIYPPGDTKFLPGGALANATVTAVKGDDATVSIEPARPAAPRGSRAVALAPPPASDRIPIRLDRVESKMRAGLEGELSKLLPSVEFVDGSEFARFIIDIEGGVARVYGAGGLQEVVSFTAKNAKSVAVKIAGVLTRFAGATALLTLDNQASALQLDVRLVSGDAGGATRAIEVAAASAAPVYRIRRSGEPRSPENSLMLEVQTSRDSYVTVVDVDTEGGINILFPNAAMKKGFHPDGLIPGGRPIRLPDSVETPNRAGFFWDYQPPAGLDTLRVFAMTDLETARKLRVFIERMKSGPATRGQDAVQTRGAAKPSATFHELARVLVRSVTTRGVAVVADVEKPEAPSQAEAKVHPAGGPDWTAASLTLVIE